MRVSAVVGLPLVLLSLSAVAIAAPRPNIVLVMTDDQGYGDLGCTGNPIVKTPNIDRLAEESSQLSDYHVAPTCSPTRAALMTGHWSNRTGVWHTINGRSMLRANEVTIAQILKDAGYATGLFGKWHLGDNYPYRPEDRGFTEVYRHGGGGVGQTPDVWNNAYFDGHYFHNGQIVAAEGFCTDVFFRQAERFIRECAGKQQPFFAYLPTNAPHSPLHAPREYLDMYGDQKPNIAAFHAMITNIDDNVGKLRQLLNDLGIERDTIFIFTTDNGTATGAAVFNAGMRGAKGSEYDGGHRVPLFLHWPGGGMNRKHISDRLAHAVDIAPTLLDLVGVESPQNVKFDGVSIRKLLEPHTTIDWPDRFLITDSQRVRDPIKWKQSAVMSQDWRLINGRELYAIKDDPGQQRDVAAEHPEQVARMREFYEQWWAELEPTFSQTTEIYLGHPDHSSVTLTAHDWIQEAMPPWNQAQIRQAAGMKSAANPAPRRNALRPAAPASGKHEGYWAVNVVSEGEYEISLRRWPTEADQPITAALPAGDEVPGAGKPFRAVEGRAVPATSATLRIDDSDLETKPVASDAKAVCFTVRLSPGSHRLAPVFVLADGSELGAYYATVRRLP